MLRKASSGGINPPSDTVFVGNLPPQATTKLLYELCIQAGSVVRLRLVDDSKSTKPGFAFCQYTDVDSARYAVDLLSGNVSLFGRMLSFNFSKGSGGGAGGPGGMGGGGAVNGSPASRGTPPASGQQGQQQQQQGGHRPSPLSDANRAALAEVLSRRPSIGGGGAAGAAPASMPPPAPLNPPPAPERTPPPPAEEAGDVLLLPQLASGGSGGGGTAAATEDGMDTGGAAVAAGGGTAAATEDDMDTGG